jgi:cell division transport system ATP-binding protein
MKKTVISLSNAGIYQGNQLVLNNVNLRVEEGELCYLIGRTGSGKSSLLKTLYAELPLLKGEGEVAGFSLNSLKWEEVPFLRRRLGIVFQDFILLHDRDIEANMLFVLEATGWTDLQKMKTRIEEVLSMVGLRYKGNKMPHELSGGEQQRVAVARALLNSPSVILADEPTGNLDPETSDEILLLLRQLAIDHQTAVIMATHDYMILEKFTARIIRCQGGQLIEEENFALED